MKKKSSGLFSSTVFCFVVLLLLCMLAFSLYQLVPKLLEYKSSDDAFTELSADVTMEFDPAALLDMSQAQDADTSDALTIDWDAFAGTEIVAWFQMDEVSYPIMQGSDNSYYLHRLPDGTYNSSGSLFLLAENSPLLTDNSSFVYGHNMNNGSMFGCLKQYTTAASEDHMFYIYLPDGTRHQYQFFSVATVLQESKAYTWSFKSDETFLEWQDWMLEQSLVKTSCETSKDARYVTLSTCNGYAGTNKRLVVCGQEVRSDRLQEPASWYMEYLEGYENKTAGKLARQQEIQQMLQAQQRVQRDLLFQRYRGQE